MKTYPELVVSCPEDEQTRLATVLQSGFYVSGIEGDSILSLLSSLPGFTTSYIADKIQTIFFNGDALDDAETLLYGPHATVALGGAMPGLAGAIVKKGSPWGALRKTKTAHDTGYSGEQVEVVVKLFNTIAVDRGGQLLNESVHINSRDLIHFLELRPSLLYRFTDISFNGKPVEADKLSETVASYKRITLTVRQP